MWSMGFIEVHDARRMPQDWAQSGFDDSSWGAVQILRSGGGAPEAPFGGMAIEPFPALLPREIPFLAESPLAPERVLRWYGVEPRPSDAVDQRLYQEDLIDLPDGLVTDPGKRCCTPTSTPPRCARARSTCRPCSTSAAFTQAIRSSSSKRAAAR
jgi:hypothetical protein